MLRADVAPGQRRAGAGVRGASSAGTEVLQPPRVTRGCRHSKMSKGITERERCHLRAFQVELTNRAEGFQAWKDLVKSQGFAFRCKAGSCPAQSALQSISWVTPLHLPLIFPAASPQRAPSCRSSSHQHPPGSWHPPSRQGTALKLVTPPWSSSSPALSISCPTEGALVATGHLHLLPIHVPCLLSRWHCWL